MKRTYIFHIARKTDWDKAQLLGQYRASSLETEQLIHASTTQQVCATANRLFRGEGDLLLLKLDEGKLQGLLRYEAATNGSVYPHIYGTIPLEAVTAVVPFQEFEQSGYVLPAAMGNSIFSKIIRGELPSYLIYEDEWTYSLLTREPIQLGHTLVVPKIEVDHFSEMPEPYYSAVFGIAKKISHALQRATQCGRVGMVIAGWEVPHVHLHLIPTMDLSDFDFKKAKMRSVEENSQMQKAIRRELGLA